jgi:hypothetical protein
MKTLTEMNWDELLNMLRAEIREIVREELHKPPTIPTDVLNAPLNFPVDDVGPWPERLNLTREEFYADSD